METEGELQVRKSRIINSADLSAFIQSLDLAFITLLRCSTVRHRKARTANERDSRQQAAGGRQQAAGNKRQATSGRQQAAVPSAADGRLRRPRDASASPMMLTADSKARQTGSEESGWEGWLQARIGRLC